MNLFGDFLEGLKGLEAYTPHKSAGRIVACNDGVLTIDGIPDVRNGELLELADGTQALAMNLEQDSVGAILFSESKTASAGDYIYSTGRVAGVPVGKKLLGRVIDPLGNPLDGLNKIRSKSYRPTEFHAPAIYDRAKVTRPFYTGIKAIDTMIPIGKGQRELIIGDRQTGKTAIAIDAIINQKGKNVICIYVAIGQKASSISRIIEDLTRCGAMKYTVIVASTASQTAPMQYLAPYTGTAIAESFMYEGKDVLIVYDDLSKHAVAYRTISLLLRRPSGREAYPGDVFYIHSRLLERSAQLNQASGGGSITALPIVETLAGDISAYIPTNIISITDGQIYLEPELFNSGIRPAVNVGLSVSRVGGSAQCKAVRKLGARVRLDHARYRELQLFARFGGELDSSTRNALEKGDILTECLKQPQFSPVGMPELVCELFLLNRDLLKGISPDKVKDFVSFYIEQLGKEDDILKEIGKKGELTEEMEKHLTEMAEYCLKEYNDR